MNTGFYLTLMMGRNKPVAVPPAVIDALTAVEVHSGQPSGFQLSFTLAKRSHLNIALLPSGYFEPEVRVIIVVTINGTPNVLMDGVITQQQLSPSSAPGQSSLTITGEDLTRMMDLTELTGKENYGSQTTQMRVVTILDRYRKFGLVPKVETGAEKIQQTEKQITPTHHGTDLQDINLLANHEGYVFYLEPGPAPGMNVAYWGPEIKTGIPQPALTLNMDAQTNVESLNFSYNGFAKSDFLVDVLDEDAERGREVSVPAITALNPPLGAKTPPALRKEKLKMTGKYGQNQAASAGRAKAS